MDEIDLTIIKKLFGNSRLTYRELANMVELGVSAIHKRIRKLEDDGVINAYTARPSISALKSIWIMIFGTSKAKSLELVSKELGQHENVEFIAIAGGKFLYISAFIRNISELQDYSSYASKVSQIDNPTIGIINIPYVTIPESLATIDYKILRILNRDARKSITNIADDVGLSAKTVRKRLDHMIENNLAEFSIEYTPLYDNSFITVFHISLKEGTDISSTTTYLENKYDQNIAHCYSYSNIPNFMTITSWTKTAQESQMLQKELQSEGFKDVVPHIFLSLSWYDCWIDQLLRSK
jgi:DNA-binding Lrp family transcriptional regulator